MKTCPACRRGFSSNFAVCPLDATPLAETAVWYEGLVIRGKYRILSELGRGGMGAVYKALHLGFDEPRALKVMNPMFMSDITFVKRFQKEAFITRKLQHPNAVRVDDIDEAEDGCPFIVMEYIAGRCLRDHILEEGSFSVSRACAVGKQTAAALNAAHLLNMVHRDIKPANIILVPQPVGEQAKVLDFGIAKLKELHAPEMSGPMSTGSGVIVGTPAYMSPEQAKGLRGEQLDGRSDIYSLGIVMYQMLTGDLPFKADTTMQILMAHLHTQPLPIQEVRSGLQIPDEISNLVMRCLEKDPSMRPSSCEAFIECIERWERLYSSELGPVAKSADSGVRQAGPLALNALTPKESLQQFESFSLISEVGRSQQRPSANPTPYQSRHVSAIRWITGAALLIALGTLGSLYFHSGNQPASRIGASTPNKASDESSTEVLQAVPTTSPTTTSLPQLQPGTSPDGPAGPGDSKGGRLQKLRENRGVGQSDNEADQSQQESVSRAAITTRNSRLISQALSLGDFYASRGEYDSAIEEYKKALAVDPSNANALNGIRKANKSKSTAQ